MLRLLYIALCFYTTMPGICLVIFGASGDLTKKMLVPALFSLYLKGAPTKYRVIGYGRSLLTRDAFLNQLREFLPDQPAREMFLSNFCFISGSYSGDYAALGNQIKMEEGPEDRRIYYLALPPRLFSEVSFQIHRQLSSRHPRKIAIEKPFGLSWQEAQGLKSALFKTFPPNELFLVDHYLGKGVFDEIVSFRQKHLSFFKNPFCVWLRFKEKGGMNQREYFREAGIIKDIFQNHLLQVLAQFCAETTPSDTREIRATQKARFVATLRVVTTLPASYVGAAVETYSLVVLRSDSPQWSNTCFIVECGKGLDEDRVEMLFQMKKMSKTPSFTFELKPGEKSTVCGPEWSEEREYGPFPKAHEVLFSELFWSENLARSAYLEEIEAFWRLTEEVLQPKDLCSYALSATRPDEAEQLLQEIMSSK